MSVIACREIIDGLGAQQNFGENVKTKRTFMVTVDDPTTSLVEIAAAPNIKWLDAHPVFPTYCVGIDPENDGDPFHFKVSFRYDLLKPQERHKFPWQRQDKFSYDGSLASVPCFVHYNDGNNNPKLIVNSAGDPLEGLSKEQAEWTVAIRGNRQTFNKAQARQYLNAVNSDTYEDCPPGTVKCQRLAGEQEIEQVDGEEVLYWSVNTVLAYREEGWPIQTWDVGFNEIVGGQRKKILDAAGEPVSQPVALSNGVKKSPGQPPDKLTFKVYKYFPFTGVFPALP